MAVDEALNAYSTTASSNSPAGTDSVGTDLDNHLRDMKKNLAYAARWPVQAAKVTTYAHAVTDLHQWVTADTSGGAFSINLVAAATAGDGFAFGVKLLVAGNTLTIDGSGAETIDGATTITMDSQYEAVILVCDGSNWHIATGGPVEGDNVDITNTTALTALADADEILVYDATATANRKITAANFSAGMDCVLLATASASADEYITFAEVFDDTVYESYKITFTNVTPTTDGNFFVFQLGTGSTPTWLTTNEYSMGWDGITGGAAAAGSDSSEIAGAVSSGAVGNAAGEGLSGELRVYGTDGSPTMSHVYLNADTVSRKTDGGINRISVGNIVDTSSTAVTSIRFLFGTWVTNIAHTAETIAQGEFRVYGLRNA